MKQMRMTDIGLRPTIFLFLLALISMVLTLPARAETLRIGTEGTYPPFNYFNDKGELTGFDTDIALALCAEMKVECKFVPNDWQTIIDGLEAGRYDVIIASMSITEERRQRVLFTNKYYSNALRFIAPRAKAQNTLPPTDLRGQRLGAQEGSIAAAYLKQHYMQASVIRLYDNQEEVFNELLIGHLDLVLADALPAFDWLQTRDGQCCAFASPPIYGDEGIGMAVRKDDPALRDRLNAALEAILANGTYEAINKKYFPFSIY